MSTDSLTTNKSAKGSDSADQLLAATNNILAHRNSIEVSLSEIADASGLNSALIRHHFGSEDGPLVALLCRHLTAADQLNWLIKMDVPYEQKKVRLHIGGMVDTYVQYLSPNGIIPFLIRLSGKNVTRLGEVFEGATVRRIVRTFESR